MEKEKHELYPDSKTTDPCPEQVKPGARSGNPIIDEYNNQQPRKDFDELLKELNEQSRKYQKHLEELDEQ